MSIVGLWKTIFVSMSTKLHVQEDKQPTRKPSQKLLEIRKDTSFGVHKRDGVVVGMDWLTSI